MMHYEALMGARCYSKMERKRKQFGVTLEPTIDRILFTLKKEGKY
jgi:hypothetical protein